MGPSNTLAQITQKRVVPVPYPSLTPTTGRKKAQFGEWLEDLYIYAYIYVHAYRHMSVTIPDSMIKKIRGT